MSFFNRKADSANEGLATILGDPALREMAQTVLAIVNDRADLAAKSQLVFDQSRLAVFAQGAARSRVEQTLDLADLDELVAATVRANALGGLAAHSGMINFLPSFPEAVYLKIWEARHPDRHQLATEFLSALRPRLEEALRAAVAEDNAAALSVGLKPYATESEATAEIRLKVELISGNNGFASAEHAARMLFQ